MNNKLSFSSDYMEGAHPEILRRLLETNLEKTSGYGFDPIRIPQRIKSAPPVTARMLNFIFNWRYADKRYCLGAMLRSIRVSWLRKAAISAFMRLEQ